MKKNNEVIEETSNKEPITLPGRKLFSGLIVFIISMLSPLLIPLVILLNISPSSKAVLSGLLVFGVPEIGMLIAVAILGKEGFAYLKSRLFFWLKQTVIATNVSRIRYRVGIILFSTILIIDLFTPYINYFSSISIQPYQYYYIFILDFLLLVALFILGGNFWDKLKALFIYDMVAIKLNSD